MFVSRRENVENTQAPESSAQPQETNKLWNKSFVFEGGPGKHQSSWKKQTFPRPKTLVSKPERKVRRKTSFWLKELKFRNFSQAWGANVLRYLSKLKSLFPPGRVAPTGSGHFSRRARRICRRVGVRSTRSIGNKRKVGIRVASSDSIVAVVVRSFLW